MKKTIFSALIMLSLFTITVQAVHSSGVSVTAADTVKMKENLFYTRTSTDRIQKEGSIDYADGEVLVCFKDQPSLDTARARAAGYHAVLTGFIGGSGLSQWYFGSDLTYSELQDMICFISKDPDVASVGLNYVSPFTANSGTQEGITLTEMSSYNQKAEQAMHIGEARDLFLETIRADMPDDFVNVGVYDILFPDKDYDDLKFVPCPDACAGSETLVNRIKQAETDEDKNDLRHGTHVAGIIGALCGNGIGIDGVYPLAYDQRTGEHHLYTISSSVSTLDFCASLDWLLEQNVKVINISIGYPPEEVGNKKGKEEFENMVRSDAEIVANYLEGKLKSGKDFLIVSAAGNEFGYHPIWKLDSKYSNPFNAIEESEHPDIYDRIIVIGSCDTTGQLASYSNRGDRMDIMAVGTDIYSIVPDQADPMIMSGTSMAAPYVTGTAAMAWTLAPEWSGDQLKYVLLMYSNNTKGNDLFFNALYVVKKAVNTKKAHGTPSGESEKNDKKDNHADDSPLILLASFPELLDKYGAMSTDVLEGNEDRGTSELAGILNYHLEDFDLDGKRELLLTRFECTDAFTCFMDIYEVKNGQVVLADSVSVPIPGIAEEMGKYGSTAAGFIFQSDGKWRLGVESYQAFNGTKIAVNIFKYDGSSISFVRGAGYEEWGEGSVFIKEAERPSLNSMDAGWETIEKYDIEANNWAALSDEEQQRLISSYRRILLDAGLNLENDIRFYSAPREGIWENYDKGNAAWYAGKFCQKASQVYGVTEGFTSLWRIASWSSETGVLLLERDDEEK